MDGFEVVVGAGSLRSSTGVRFAHRWTPEGVSVDGDFTGGHLLHLAAAGCVLNDLYREADAFEVTISGARVTARGGFDPQTWASTGITYDVELDAEGDADATQRLIEHVDAVAEIPKALRSGAEIWRTPIVADN